MNANPDTSSADIFSKARLPCGKSLKNRLVKVALYEHLANFRGGPPNERHLTLYSEWSQNEWGMIITGNVQVSEKHLSLGCDLVVPKTVTEESILPFKRLASAMKGHVENGTDTTHTLAIAQLSHAGRQSPNLIGGRFPLERPVGPSAVRVGSLKPTGGLTYFFHWLMFQEPIPLTTSGVDEVVASFVRGAIVCQKAGFDGIQLHAAHGYLLAQFISPKSNRRTDEYSPDNIFFLRRLVDGIRKAVPTNFAVGIKVNSADYAESKDQSVGDKIDGETKLDERALGHIREISSWEGIDFIEISGGDYENPEFMEVRKSISTRQALFSRFSTEALKVVNEANAKNPPLILLTGGLRTPAQLHAALHSQHTQLLGIGRGSITCPSLPRLLKEKCSPTDTEPFGSEPNLDLKVPWPFNSFPRIPLVGASVGLSWYTVKLHDLAYGVPERYFTPWQALYLMWIPRENFVTGFVAFFFAIISLFLYMLIT